MVETFGWIALALSLIGNVFIIYKHYAGFLIWIASNVFWVVVDLQAGLYSQAILFAVYTVFAVWGLVKWLRDSKRHRMRCWSYGLPAEAVIVENEPCALDFDQSEWRT